MRRFNTKSYGNIPIAIDKNYICTQGEGKKIINCAICGKVEVPYSYTVYTFNGKDFCSHTHKHKYIKEHPEEAEITESERVLAKFIEVSNRYLSNKKNSNVNKPSRPVPYICYIDGIKYDSISKASKAVFGRGNALDYVRNNSQTNEFDYKGHHIKVIPYGVDENE